MRRILVENARRQQRLECRLRHLLGLQYAPPDLDYRDQQRVQAGLERRPAIAGQATGRAALGQMAILFLVICAALLHTSGLALKRRLRTRPPPHRDSS